MQKLIAMISIVVLSGCTSKTDFGPCIGIADDKNQKLEYKVSAWNAVLGIVFFGTVVVPVYVLVDQTFCPVGTK